MPFCLYELLARPGTAAPGGMIRPGPGWGIGSSGAFPGLAPPAPALMNEPMRDGDITRAAFRIDGLRVDVRYEAGTDHNILRWAGRILNDGEGPVRCHRPRSLALMLDTPGGARIKTFSLKGGVGTGGYPPDSFTFRQCELFPGLLDRLDSGRGGYSTNNDIPMCVIQVGDEGGLFWALEWPASWWACTNRLQEDPEKIWLEAGPVARLQDYEQVEEVDILLEPGESIPLPPCVLGLYRGDEAAGCNALREYISAQSPRLPGDPAMPPVSFNTWFGTEDLGLGTSEEGLKRHIDAAARIGAEYFVHDAGWYQGSNRSGHTFMVGTGNWRKENPEKFPHGLEAVAAYVEARGMKFGIWWAPENCDGTSAFAAAFPDAVLPLRDGDPTMVGNWCLADFGNADVVRWLKETLDLIVPRFRVQWLRWDLNIYPEPCWDRADPEGRRGITMIRHIEGLLDLWDHLLTAHPQVCIEACCGGGRRMDLACLRRAHTCWCNDMSREPDLQRYENTGANHFLPSTYMNRNILFEGTDGYPAAYYRGLFAGALGFGDPVGDWTDKAIEQAAAQVCVYKKVRRFLHGRYRPLFGQPRRLDDWDGWQFHDAESDSGMILCFRCHSPIEEQQVQLGWISAEADYTFRDPFDGDSHTRAGTDPLVVSAPKRGSRLLVYRPVIGAQFGGPSPPVQ